MHSRPLHTSVFTLVLGGLLLLAASLSRAASEPVLSIYISNTGMQLTFGLSDTSSPLYQSTLNTWDSPDLNGQPPNIMFNDSPALFFKDMMERTGPSVRALIQKHNLEGRELKVYIAAAGANAALLDKNLPKPAVLDVISDAEAELCYQPEKHRTGFFACFFTEEIKTHIARNMPLSLRLVQDAELINAMATIHARNVRPDEAILVVHATTLSQPYIILNNEPFSGWMTQTGMEKSGGLYQVGMLLSAILNNPDKQLLKRVIAADERTGYYPGGAEKNLQNFLTKPRRFNNFGRIASETANKLNQARINFKASGLNEQDYLKAADQALPLVQDARQDFVRLTALLFIAKESMFSGNAPRVIVVGEDSDVIMPQAQIFADTAASMQASNSFFPPLMASTITGYRQDLNTGEKRQRWLQSNLGRLTGHVSVMPVSEFASFQHQASVRLLKLQ